MPPDTVSDMGLSTEKPLLAKVNNGNQKSCDDGEFWVVLEDNIYR